MCTNLDRIATKKEEDRLKKTGKGHAWKIVIDDSGTWRPPFRHARFDFIPVSAPAYNKTGINMAVGYRSFEAGRVTQGSFHCCLTRKIARQIVKSQVNNERFLWNHSIFPYKIVKVIFCADDFVGIGKMDYIDQENWGLPIDHNDSICITKFKFAEK